MDAALRASNSAYDWRQMEAVTQSMREAAAFQQFAVFFIDAVASPELQMEVGYVASRSAGQALKWFPENTKELLSFPARRDIDVIAVCPRMWPARKNPEPLRRSDDAQRDVNRRATRPDDDSNATMTREGPFNSASANLQQSFDPMTTMMMMMNVMQEIVLVLRDLKGSQRENVGTSTTAATTNPKTGWNNVPLDGPFKNEPAASDAQVGAFLLSIGVFEDEAAMCRSSLYFTVAQETPLVLHCTLRQGIRAEAEAVAESPALWLGVSGLAPLEAESFAIRLQGAISRTFELTTAVMGRSSNTRHPPPALQAESELVISNLQTLARILPKLNKIPQVEVTRDMILFGRCWVRKMIELATLHIFGEEMRKLALAGMMSVEGSASTWRAAAMTRISGQQSFQRLVAEAKSSSAGGSGAASV